MSDLIHRSLKAKELLGDVSFAKRQRIEPAFRAFAGLVVSDLDLNVREQLEEDIRRINARIVSASIMDADDYESMSDTDADDLLALIDTAAARAIEAELDRIMAELDAAHETLPEDTIREAREHRELMVPRLVRKLTDTLARVRKGKMPHGNAHFFAIFLLTEFEAHEAFDVIVEAFSLPGDLPHDLFGEAVTSTLPRILALFAAEHIETIDRMIGDLALNEFIRWAAADAYGYLARDGRLGRSEAVERLRKHLRHATAEDDQEIASGLVGALHDMVGVEALEDIRDAFRRDVVDASIIDLESVEERFAEGHSGQDRFYDELSATGMPDTIEELREWAMFEEEEEDDEFEGDEEFEEDEESEDYGALDWQWPLSASPPAAEHDAAELPEAPAPHAETIRFDRPRVGRNDPCPCGSGKKFKKCCGARGSAASG